MRGRNKLFNDLIEASPALTKKGRSNELHEKRNRTLIYRYYFYVSHTKMRYEAILQQLSCEFYISPTTIQGQLDNEFEFFNEVKKAKPEVRNLKSMFPHLIWDEKAIV